MKRNKKCLSHLLLLICFVIGSSIFTSCKKEKILSVNNDQLINFRGSVKEAGVESAKRHRPIFLLLCSKTCGHCIRLRSTTLQDRRVINFFNENFITMMADVDTSIGFNLMSQYNPTFHTPTIVFLDSDAKSIKMIEGVLSADNLLKIGERILQPYKEAYPSLNNGIIFKNSMESALTQAQEEKKPIFMLIYSNRCGHCKRLKEEALQDKTLIKYLNTHFVCLQAETSTDEGKELYKKYTDREGVPAMVLLNSKGERIKIILGNLPAEKILSDCQEIVQQDK